ncbi:NAD-P-binding protein [Byssothecium circinans]|uniref:NAD-P-binding protein n=1 Tax=Byssothecium circinans TaxID=147558 RepID=A0A6A5UG29_9PLEO|nr:NAD-P-binding protein [Byssothecium circinans]
MAPIKVGFIGLSSNQSWSVWAHLPYLKNTTKYEVVALCNSSVDAAKAAIKAHGLPSTVKAYGNPEGIAADPNVELVVCATRVDKHYDGVMPALRAGKDVFCEWPLARNAAQAEELLKLAKEKGVKTLVGLQAPQSPVVRKVRELTRSGKLGKLLSTSFTGTTTIQEATEMEFVGYQNDINIGANLLSIYAVHSLEGLTYAIAPLHTFNPLLAINHPTVQLTDYSGNPTRTVPRTSHDQVLLHGTFSCGAPISYHLHGGPAFNKTEGCIWRIFFSKGEIQVTGPNTFLNAADDGFKIEVFDHESGETKVVEVEKDAFSTEAFTPFSRNMARLYEAFADGKGEDEGVLDWESALKRHQFVSEVYEKAGVKVN